MIKKNKLFLFIVLFLFMFVGIDSVNAAKEMYCVYDENGSNIIGAPTLMLVQSRDGSRYVYIIDGTSSLGRVITFDSFSWRKKTLETNEYVFGDVVNDFTWISSEKLDANGDLLSCPSGYIWNGSRYDSDSLYVRNLKKIQFESGSNYSNSLSALSSTYVELDESMSNDTTYNDNRDSDDFLFHEIASENEYIINNSNYTLFTVMEQLLVNPNLNVERTCLYTAFGYFDDDGGEIVDSLQIDVSFSQKKVYIAAARLQNNEILKLTDIYPLWTDLSYSTFETKFSNGCPDSLYALFKTDVTATSSNYFMLFNDSYVGPESTIRYTLSMEDGALIRIDDNIVDINNCSDIFGSELLEILRGGINFAKILIPIILIVLGIVDFVQATFGSKEDEMKKATSRFIKRVIIAVVIFFIPSILNILLTIADAIWGNIDPTLCGLL